ncbi:hypothetical protein [Streptomyces phaeochromogenes]|uniref:hypothetical protein n=1 Tax=Streptomyces phaeochromogenes TaxID=1923 RepID=UPI003863B457|nr:hypothetical protein OG277_08640 [Streptomyces phaeochromogenes]
MAQPVQWGRIAFVVGATILSFMVSLWIVHEAPFDWLPEAPAERWLVATAFATIVATAVLTTTSLSAGSTPTQIIRRATLRISGVERSTVRVSDGIRSASGNRTITDVRDSKVVVAQGLGIGATVVLLAALAVVMVALLTHEGNDSKGDSNGSSPSPTPSPSTATEKDPKSLNELPDSFTDSSCLYEVTNDHGRGAEAVQINDDGRVSQPFTATQKGYVWGIRAVIGYESPVEPGPVVLQFLKDGNILESEPATIKNNESTEYRFYPVRVEPGAVYEFRVNNESGIRLGIYMAPSDDYPNLEKASVSKEKNRPDGLRDKVLSGCVMDAQKK